MAYSAMAQQSTTTPMTRLFAMEVMLMAVHGAEADATTELDCSRYQPRCTKEKGFHDCSCSPGCVYNGRTCKLDCGSSEPCPPRCVWTGSTCNMACARHCRSCDEAGGCEDRCDAEYGPVGSRRRATMKCQACPLVEGGGIASCLASPLCAALCLTILLGAFKNCLKIRLLKSSKAHVAQAIIQQKIRRSARGGAVFDAVYWFDADRQDGSSCRVRNTSIDMDPDVWNALVEGRSTRVRYLPDQPEKCLLESELRMSCANCTMGCEKVVLNVVFIALPGGGAIGLAIAAGGSNCVMYGIIALVLNAVVLIVWAVNINRFSAWLDKCFRDKDQVKEIVMGTPDASQGAVLGVPAVDASVGANTLQGDINSERNTQPR